MSAWVDQSKMSLEEQEAALRAIVKNAKQKLAEGRKEAEAGRPIHLDLAIALASNVMDSLVENIFNIVTEERQTALRIVEKSLAEDAPSTATILAITRLKMRIVEKTPEPKKEERVRSLWEIPNTAGVRGRDFPCEKCHRLDGSVLQNGFYRCRNCGHPGQ